MISPCAAPFSVTRAGVGEAGGAGDEEPGSGGGISCVPVEHLDLSSPS